MSTHVSVFDDALWCSCGSAVVSAMDGGLVPVLDISSGFSPLSGSLPSAEGSVTADVVRVGSGLGSGVGSSVCIEPSPVSSPSSPVLSGVAVVL